MGPGGPASGRHPLSQQIRGHFHEAVPDGPGLPVRPPSPGMRKRLLSCKLGFARLEYLRLSLEDDFRLSRPAPGPSPFRLSETHRWSELNTLPPCCTPAPGSAGKQKFSQKEASW